MKKSADLITNIVTECVVTINQIERDTGDNQEAMLAVLTALVKATYIIMRGASPDAETLDALITEFEINLRGTATINVVSDDNFDEMLGIIKEAAQIKMMMEGM